MRGVLLVLVVVVIAGEAAAAPPYAFTPPPGWTDATARTEQLVAETRAKVRGQADYDVAAFGDDGVQLVVIEHFRFPNLDVSTAQLVELESPAPDVRDYSLIKGPRIWKSTQRTKAEHSRTTIWRYSGFIGRGTHVIVASCFAADAVCDRILSGLIVPETPFRPLANLRPISDDDERPPNWLPWGSGATSLILAGLFAAYVREKRKRQAS